MVSEKDLAYEPLSGHTISTRSSTGCASRFAKFCYRHLPILEWLPQYKQEYLFKDVSGGITLGLMCLSQTLAQAAIATTLPVSGPYCAFVPPIIYAMMGTSRHASVSSGAMGCILIANVLDPEMPIAERTELASFIALIAGCLQILMGVCNLAFAVRFLSHATISGFVTGGAVLIMTSQLKNVFGYEHMPHANGALPKLWAAAKNYKDANVPNLCLCIGLLVTLEVCKKAKPWAKKKAKNSLRHAWWAAFAKVVEMKEILVIIIGSVFAYCTMVDGEALIPIVGDIPTGLPSFNPPFGKATMDLLNGPAERLHGFLLSAAMIAFTSFLTTYASNKKIALACGYELDASQELCALGTASAVGSCFGAFLVCGSLSRTALAAQLGTQTQVCSFVIAAIIGMVLLFLSPMLFFLPKAALGAIVLTSAKGLMDFKTPTEIWHSSTKVFTDSLRKDFVVWCVGFGFTILFGALVGIALSVAVGISQVVAEATAPRAVVLGSVPRLGGQMRDISYYEDAQTFPGILVFEFRGPLCFCSAEGFHEELMSRITEDTRGVVLSFAVVPYIDYSALSVLKDTLVYFQRSGIHCALAEVKSSVERVLKEKLGDGANPLVSFLGTSATEAVVLINQRIHDFHRTTSKEERFLFGYREESEKHFTRGFHRHLSE